MKEPLVDVHSFRHTITTILADAPGLDNGWIDEITGHASKARESESTRYTKEIHLSHLNAALDAAAIAADLSHLRYAGPRGVAAPGAREDIEMSGGSPSRRCARRRGGGRGEAAIGASAP